MLDAGSLADRELDIYLRTFDLAVKMHTQREDEKHTRLWPPTHPTMIAPLKSWPASGCLAALPGLLSYFGSTFAYVEASLLDGMTASLFSLWYAQLLLFYGAACLSMLPDFVQCRYDSRDGLYKGESSEAHEKFMADDSVAWVWQVQ